MRTVVWTQKDLVPQIRMGATLFEGDTFKGHIYLNTEELGLQGKKLIFRRCQFDSLSIVGRLESICLEEAKIAGTFDASAAEIFDIDDFGLTVGGQIFNPSAFPRKGGNVGGGRSAHA